MDGGAGAPCYLQASSERHPGYPHGGELFTISVDNWDLRATSVRNERRQTLEVDRLADERGAIRAPRGDAREALLGGGQDRIDQQHDAES